MAEKKSYPPRSSPSIVESGQIARPVFGIDVDGTLGEYHDHFIRFAEAWLGKEIPRGFNGEGSLAKWCGISKTTYRKVKMAYRRGGLKRSMPVYEGARELTVALRKRGALVVICTTRPFLSLEAVDEDTRHWLTRRARVQFDGIIHGEHKYRDLVRAYGRSRIVAVVDDLPEMMEQSRRLGVPSVRKVAPHNEQYEWTPSARSLPELQGVLLGLLDEWEAANR